MKKKPASRSYRNREGSGTPDGKVALVTGKKRVEARARAEVRYVSSYVALLIVADLHHG